MKKANQTRTMLLTYINKESNCYLRNKCNMKINSRTSKEILSQFEAYEIQINYAVITCTSMRSTVQINTMISRKNSTKIEDDNISDEVTLASEIKNYIEEIDKRKVLFSKKKLKHPPSIKNKEIEKAKPPSYDNKKEHNQKLIKNGIIFLHKIVHRIKLPHNGKKEVASSKLLLKPRKKPMSMKIAEMKKITNSSKKHSCQISNNNYDFKINLHKLDGDIMSDETNDNDNISSNYNTKRNLCSNSKMNKTKNQSKYVDSSMSDDEDK